MAARTRDILRREKMDITLPTLIDLFITTKKAEGKSSKTLRWYQANLERFADHLGTGAGARLSEVTVDDARDFVSKLQTQDIPHGNYAGPLCVYNGETPRRRRLEYVKYNRGRGSNPCLTTEPYRTS